MRYIRLQCCSYAFAGLDGNHRIEGLQRERLQTPYDFYDFLDTLNSARDQFGQ